MKNRSRKKPMSMQKKDTRSTPVNHSIFEMLVNSLNETRAEEHLVRMLKMTEILK